jgi:DNA-binding protein
MSDAAPTKTLETKAQPDPTPTKADAKADQAAERKQHRNKDGKETPENEIRVKAKGQIQDNLRYAFRILNKTDFTFLKISATGNAIVKALILIELVKRRVGNLHQINRIDSDVIITEEETKIEDMPKMETKRRVTKMETILSKEPLDENDIGYQAPEPKETTEKTTRIEQQKRKKRGPKVYNPDSAVGGKNEGGKRRDGE